MRIIDADALGVGRCNPDVMLDRAYAAGWNGIINIINDAPTIDPIRVAGGCRCGECKRYGPGPFGYGCHTMFDGKAAVIPHDLDYFCGDSELREAKDDD